MEKNLENEMETREYIRVILGLYGSHGKENGNYFIRIACIYIYI